MAPSPSRPGEATRRILARVIVEAPRGRLSLLRRARFLALAAVGMVVGHDAVYLAAYGPTYHQSMAATGHGYWLSFSLLVLVAAGIPLVAALAGLGRLSLLAAGRGDGRGRRARRGAGMGAEAVTISSLAGTTIRMAATIIAAYTVQENLEQVLAGMTPGGLFVLDPPAVLPVLSLISLLLAVAGTWLRWREASLRRRLAANSPATLVAGDGTLPAPAATTRIAAHSLWLASIPSGRAPPLAIA